MAESSMDSREEIDTVEYYAHTLVHAYRDKTAILFKGAYRTQSYSYTELYDYARRVVTFLSSRGIKKGDTVGIWSYNSPSWVAFLLGCSMAGVIFVPVDFSSPPDFARTIAEKAGVRSMLVSRIKDSDLPVPKFYVEDFLDEMRNFEPAPLSAMPTITPDDLLEIVYTSGTTGTPKGVIITNRNIVSEIRGLSQMMGLDEDSRFLSLMPLSHLFEQVLGLFTPLRFGGSVLYVATRKSSELFRLTNELRITAILGVPLLLDSLKDSIFMRIRSDYLRGLLKKWIVLSQKMRLKPRALRILSYPLRRRLGKDLKFFICGGAKLAESTEDFWNSLGISVLQGYGLTETSPVISCNVMRDRKEYSVGKVIPGVVVRIAPDGEVLVQGPNVTTGYYRDEEATRAVFEEGWFRTGDIGELDGDGFLFIRGRKKEMILTASGLNVFPQDIETVLNSSPFVKESCVVASEQEGRTKICAALLLADAAAETAAEIVRRANERLSDHQRIHVGVIWPFADFPKTASMKIKRREVEGTVKELLSRPEAVEHPPSRRERGTRPDLGSLLADFLQTPGERIQPGLKLTDNLGLDSLRMVELVVALEERYGIEFDEGTLGQDSTVQDLERLIDTASLSSGSFPTVSWARSPVVAPVRNFLQGVSGLLLHKILTLEVEEQHPLSDCTLPVIFVANHTSHLDTFAVLRSLPPLVRKRTAVAAAADYFFGIDQAPHEKQTLHRKLLPLLAPLILNAFPFSRRAYVRKSLGLFGEVLDKGWSVLIYPEGTRSMTGEIAPFKPGIGLIAAEMRAPVIPVKLDGLFRVLPKGSRLPRKGRAKVTFGRPLRFDRRRDYHSVAKEIEETLRAL
jgi:long-chain acyl-CoA synthetase